MKKIFLLFLILLFIADGSLFAKPKKKAKASKENPVEYEENPDFKADEFELGEALKEVLEKPAASAEGQNGQSGVQVYQEDVLGQTEHMLQNEQLGQNEMQGQQNDYLGQTADVDGDISPEDSEIADVSDLSEEIDDLDEIGSPEDYLDEKEFEKLGGNFNNNNLIRLPHRYFQIGMKTDFGASNNFFNVKDLFKKELEIDLNEVSDKMPEGGWKLNVFLNSEVYIGFDLKNKLDINICSGLEGYGEAVVSKEMFDYIGKGFKLYEPLSVGGSVCFDSFAYSEISVGFDLFGFHVSVVPAFIRPLIHVESQRANLSYVNSYDGSLNVGAFAQLRYYSFTDLEPIFDGTFSSVSSDAWLGWGFDLGLNVEHKIFNTLQGGAYIRIPFIPGHLTHSADVLYGFNFYLPGMKEMFNGDYNDPEYIENEKVYGSEGKYVSRPFRTGIQLAWRPFGRWCTFGALGGLGVKYMFTKDAVSYFEYDLSCEMRFVHMLGTWVKTQYKNELFKHELGLLFNFRVCELDLGVSVQGADFVNSFKGSGAGAFVNLAIGF